MKIRTLYCALLLSLTVGLGSCSKNSSSNEQTSQTNEQTSQTKDTLPTLETLKDTLATKQDCSGDIICTEIFSTVSATVKTKDNAPVELDSYKIIQTATGTERKPSPDAVDFETQRKSGVYPIVTDANVKELANTEMEVEFIGYKAGKEIVKQKIVVGADCCHVKHIRGELEIVVEK